MTRSQAQRYTVIHRGHEPSRGRGLSGFSVPVTDSREGQVLLLCLQSARDMNTGETGSFAFGDQPQS